MRIYFSGIGGVGIGPLAEIAKDAGYEIAGSDRESSLMTDQLIGLGAEISFDQSGDFLREQHLAQALDWFVYTAALPDNHPELVMAGELGIRTAKRDELLAYIIKQKNLKLIAITGTHGKTTTTGMMIWAMQQLNMPVSYLVGSTLTFGPSGKFADQSPFLIYECDEFDRNFLHFSPWLSLITTIDYDHPDTYPTQREYTEAFGQFTDQSSKIITWSKYQDLCPSDKTIFLDSADPHIKLIGEHNRANASLVKTALESILEADQDIVAAINSFPGTGRRFEKMADNLYSDYGHHPNEIAATLQMAREISDEVVLVYQPHQNVRQHEIKDQYTDCLELAETTFWLPTYLTRENPDLEILQPSQLTKNLTNPESIIFAHLDDQLWTSIQAARDQGKLVLCMGAGTIDGWLRERLASS